MGVRSRHSNLSDLAKQHKTIKKNVKNVFKSYGPLLPKDYKKYLKNSVKASKQSNKLFTYEALKKESKDINNSKRVAKWDKKITKHKAIYDNILKDMVTYNKTRG